MQALPIIGELKLTNTFLHKILQLSVSEFRNEIIFSTLYAKPQHSNLR